MDVTTASWTRGVASSHAPGELPPRLRDGCLSGIISATGTKASGSAEGEDGGGVGVGQLSAHSGFTGRRAAVGTLPERGWATAAKEQPEVAPDLVQLAPHLLGNPAGRAEAGGCAGGAERAPRVLGERENELLFQTDPWALPGRLPRARAGLPPPAALGHMIREGALQAALPAPQKPSRTVGASQGKGPLPVGGQDPLPDKPRGQASPAAAEQREGQGEQEGAGSQGGRIL